MMATVERNFNHPYQPYDIQKEFMNALYGCLERSKVGIFESPTGTGKSLSLICGSLTWSRDHRREDLDRSDCDADDSEPDWITQHAREIRRRTSLQIRAGHEARLAVIRENEDKARKRYEDGEPPTKKLKRASDDGNKNQDEDALFALEDYESENEAPATQSESRNKNLGLSAATQALMDKLAPMPKSDDDDVDLESGPKIFYCSRTHSQLSQFVNELRRVKLPPAIPATDVKAGETERPIEEFKHAALGSRKNLCINPKVSKLGSATAINERCLELQQSKVAEEQKCPYLPKKDNEALVLDFRDHAMARVRDIEDFGKLGRKIGICPYYASRIAAKDAEIVTLPYPLLLQKSAREALNIDLKGHVVIIDEAHNLLDVIANINSTSISKAQLHRARSELTIYLQKFRTRLKGKNRVYVTQLLRVIDSLSAYFAKVSAGSASEGETQVGELMSGNGTDQINLFKLARYLQESKLARKVDGYTDYLKDQAPEPSTKGQSLNQTSGAMPVLTHVQSFLMSLTNPAAEGRFFFEKAATGETQNSDVTLKYLLLDPTQAFRDVVEDAKSVVLAGGTMSPMEDYTRHLFHYLPPDRIMTLSCGHVIPPTNLLAMPVGSGVADVAFDFRFERRKSEAMIAELGETICAAAGVVPDGLVVFFPSYAYLNSAVDAWKKPSANKSPLWDRLEAQKGVFVEPKSTRTFPSSTKGDNPTQELDTVDKVLSAYTHQITSGAGSHGALLFAVIGGSLSEGINFSDRLGRCIVVVGLPFPNAHSAEWKAKLEYIEQRTSKAGGNGKEAAREFLENACMRAVNQSVGRAIRHKDDYAVILLFDSRYRQHSIRSKLPGWIRESVREEDEFSGVLESMRGFFAGKQGG